MAWCLSTGSTWVFGVIFQFGEEYVMRMIKPIKLQLSAADKGDNSAVAIQQILWTLTCWVSQKLLINCDFLNLIFYRL